MMKTRAAVAVEAGKPLEIMEVNLGPKRGEVLVEIKATVPRMSSPTPAMIEGIFPCDFCCLAMRGAGIVMEIGEG
jgi:S-(hydroxymethyl)glutathione dehydrogenase/alcohol dehydrogenase